MLTLAVATDAETFHRLQSNLPDRGIQPTSIETAGRIIPIHRGEQHREPRYDSGRDSLDVGFVFPPRLAEGGLADAILDIPWVNGREQTLRSRFKGETLARLDRAGHPIADTVVVSNPVDEGELVEAFEMFDKPVVVKPNSTTRGAGIAMAHDLDSFLGICDYLNLIHDYRATSDRSFVVQEYLDGARDYRAMAIDGSYAGAVQRSFPDGSESNRWKHNVHRGARAEGIRLPTELQRLVESVAETLDIPWLGVDLLVTDNRVVVNETNARPTIDSATKYEDGFWDDLATLIRNQR